MELMHAEKLKKQQEELEKAKIDVVSPETTAPPEGWHCYCRPQVLICIQD